MLYSPFHIYQRSGTLKTTFLFSARGITMIFEGDRDFPLKLSDVWAKLRDARWLVQCIPDTSPGEHGEPDRATCSVRPGFAFVRGSLDVVLEVAEAAESQSLRFLVTSKGIGSS